MARRIDHSGSKRRKYIGQGVIPSLDSHESLLT
jgi:hypothetical protein